MNRGTTSHSVKNRLLASLRLAALAVAAAGVATPPLFAQPAPCAPPTVTVTTSPEPVAEPVRGSATVEFEIGVDIGGAEYCFWEVTYQTGGGDATPRDDYRPISPTTDCRSGNDTIRGSVDVRGDTESEPDETFEVQVPSILVGGCAEGESFAIDEFATVTIANYAAPSVSIEDLRIEEGDEGTTNALFTVRAEPRIAQPLSVSYQTEDVEATVSDGDYKARFGSLTIPAEEPYEATITVPVVGDTRVEEDETFVVLLTRADGAEIAGEGVGVGTILNDDEPDAVRIVEAPAVPRGAGSANVVVERLAPSGGPAQVTVTASRETAPAGEDSDSVTEGEPWETTNVVSWEAGEGGRRTVEILLPANDLAEGVETIRVELTDPEGATLGEPSAVDLVLEDDGRQGEAGEPADAEAPAGP